MLSKNVKDADGARWEITCAVEEGIPLLGVHVDKDDGYEPPETKGKQTIAWTWDGIGKWIQKL